jgi:hypothetical protein
MSDDIPEPVATGDRRDEVHFEPAAKGGVKAAHLVRPEGQPPPDGDSAAQQMGELAPEPSVFDVRVAPEGPSAWDARPVDDEDKSGNPTGH